MERYFLVNVNIDNKNVESAFCIKGGKFFSRQALIKHLLTTLNFEDSTAVISSVFEFKIEQDFLDFNSTN